MLRSRSTYKTIHIFHCFDPSLELEIASNLTTCGCSLYNYSYLLFAQEKSGISFRKQLASSLAQDNARVDEAALSPASCSSSMEVVLIVY